MAKRACLGTRGPDSGRSTRGAHREATPQTTDRVIMVRAVSLDPSARADEDASTDPVDNTSLLPTILPELSASGWFSVSLSVPKVV